MVEAKSVSISIFTKHHVIIDLMKALRVKVRAQAPQIIVIRNIQLMLVHLPNAIPGTP